MPAFAIDDSFTPTTHKNISCRTTTPKLVLGRKAGGVAGLPQRRYSWEMRPLRYSIDVTSDGCDHCAILGDEDLHRHASESLDQADALIFDLVTYAMM
jgi:hypothetical protein